MASSFAVANVSKTSAATASSSRVRAASGNRRSALRVLCAVPEPQRDSVSCPKPLGFAAGIMAAAALSAFPVDAGVILQQPEVKKLDLSTEKKIPSSSKPAPAPPSAPSLTGVLDLGFLSLPLTLVACGGLYVAASRLDSDFDSFMDTAWVKDSDVNGVGYEEICKSTDYSVAGGKSRKR